jgi:hypothetical protein
MSPTRAAWGASTTKLCRLGPLRCGHWALSSDGSLSVTLSALSTAPTSASADVGQIFGVSLSANDDGAPRGDDDGSAPRSDNRAAWTGATRAINAARANDGFRRGYGESRDGAKFSKRQNRKSGKGGPALQCISPQQGHDELKDTQQ